MPSRKQCKLCTKFARSKSDFCINHGGGRRCRHQGCTRAARDTYDYCINHGGGRRCEYEGCNTAARDTYKFCKNHGGGTRCQYQGCKKSARDSYQFCIEHGGGLRCPHCITWPDSRGGCKKYDGYCATCFKHVFPNDPRSIKIREKSHEMKVRNFLNEHMKGFIHDVPMYTGHCNCTHRRRIDHRMLIGNTMLAVETDERQHRDYDKQDEIDRYDDLYMIHSGKWIFIRFNPDSYIKNKVRCNPAIQKRLPVLLEEIQKQIQRIEHDENTELIEVIKLYYDN